MPPDNKIEDEKVPFPLNGEATRDRSCDQMTDDMLCGIGFFKPGFLQRFARMGVFTAVYSLSGLTTSSLSIYIISQITTIEKQFGFSSAQSGFILSCNDIGFLITTLFFSYIARKVHIPRTLWATTVLFGIAGIICSLAYFIAKDFITEQSRHITEIVIHQSQNSTQNQSIPVVSGFSRTPMCSLSDDNIYKIELNETTLKSTCEDSPRVYGIGQPNKFSRAALSLIALGMILQGIAKAPRLPFTATYVDDNGKKKNTAMYMGIIAGLGIFGPAIAFALGSVFSRKYVTLEAVPISYRHPAWIGAWWIGFILFGVLSIFIATPLLCFPRRIKSRQKHQNINKSPMENVDVPIKTAIIDFLKTFIRLVTNRVYMPLTAATCIQLFAVSGMMAFTPKYLETQFFIPAWKANMFLGLITVVAASAGTVTGGFVVTKRKLSPVQCVKLNLVIMLLSVIQIILGFVFGCTNASIAGQNAANFIPGTNESCETICNCDSATYFPVCGSDFRNYFSPCHAGCTQHGQMLYSNCSCIPDTIGNATPGLCEEASCKFLYPFLISTVFGSFLGTMSMMPGFIVNIRSVSEHDKSMAVGFSALLMTLVGWMAGPIVFGIIVDTACVVWSSSCSGKGACSLYDNDSLRIKKHTFELIPKCIALLLYFFVFYNARMKTDWSVDPVGTPDDNAESEKMIGCKEKDPGTVLIPDNWKTERIYKGKHMKHLNGTA